jgi:hypothetical protein
VSGRDLLYKPAVPLVIPEEESVKGKKPDAKAQKAPGARDLGHVGESVVKEGTPAGKPKAFQNAYFNKDISGVRGVNLNTSKAASLRGGEGASDLKKVVLPPSVAGIENPEPAKLRGAIDLMGLEGGFGESLEGLLNRQGAWAKGKGVTVEMLKERLAQLESMVEARKAAIARMANGRSKKPVASVTLDYARRVAGKGLDAVADVAAAGTSLVRATAAQAEGLHRRVAKVLGIKVK